MLVLDQRSVSSQRPELEFSFQKVLLEFRSLLAITVPMTLCCTRQAFRRRFLGTCCTKLLIAAARALDSPRLGVRCSRIDAFGGIAERASVLSASNDKTDQRRQSSKRAAERSKDRGVRSGQLAAEQHSQRPLRERTDTRRRAARAAAASGSRGVRLRVSPGRTCGFTTTELRQVPPPRAGPRRVKILRW